MQGFFNPNRVAVVGVSNKPTNMGRAILANMLAYGYTGEIYPVGPGGGAILGRPIYKKLSHVPAQLDCAVILTPASTVPDLMEECGRLGIKRVIIETAGFSEYSSERNDLEDQIKSIAQKYSIRFIGPNCLGIINFDNGFATPFASISKRVKKGGVSILTQSGGVGMSYLNYMVADGIGVAKFASIGNKLDVDENELLEYLLNDDQTEIICMYLEGIADGQKLMELGRKRRKAILIHKANTGTAGSKIAQSHTGAMSGDDAVTEAAMLQAGLIRVHRPNTLINYIKILELPILKGPNLVVASRSGGHAVIAADALEHYGFNLPSFPRELTEKIEKNFRASVIKLGNPLDLGDLFDLNVYSNIVEDLLKQEEIDGVIINHTYGSAEAEASRNFAAHAAELSRQYGKPVALCLFVGEQEMAHVKHMMEYPVFDSPEDAAQALALSYSIHNYLQTHQDFAPEYRPVDLELAEMILEPAITEKRNPSQAEGFKLLRHYGFETPDFALVKSAEEAARQADKIGYPVVLKVESESISHKSDVGGVRLNLESAGEVSEAFNAMQRRLEKLLPDGEQFSAMVMGMAEAGGHEVILGIKQDPSFGPVVLFGLGGIYVETLKDFSLRVAPLDAREARSMIENLKGYKALTGVRGTRPADIDALTEYILRIAQLSLDFPQIKEMDLNPVLAYEEGCKVVDVRIMLK